MLTEKYNTFLKSFFVRSEALTKEMANISNVLTAIKETLHHGTVVREVKPAGIAIEGADQFLRCGAVSLHIRWVNRVLAWVYGFP